MATERIRHPNILGVRFYARILHGITWTGAYIKSNKARICESFIVAPGLLTDEQVFERLEEIAKTILTNKPA